MKAPICTLLLFALSAAAMAQDEDLPPAQRELVSAERAFAKLAAERGFRESFITYFAEDGIGFGPHPYKVKDALSRQPPSDAPMGLNWAPAYGDVAQAGDLGWNTGPTVSDAKGPDGNPARHGMFFSVWKKQGDGNWRVVLDLGTETSAAVVGIDAPFQTSHRAQAVPGASDVNVEQEITGLFEAERAFLAAAATGTVGEAYENRLSDDARVHRPGVMPMVGKDALRDWLAQQTMTLHGEPLKADVSRSGDLGYAYGSYEQGGAEPQAGYFARVWKRDAEGRWRIVMDTINPLPPGVRPLTPQLQKAEDHYRAQEWAEAAAAYQQYIQESPDNPYAWHRLGSSQIYLGQHSQAIQSFEQAINIGGGVALDFYNLACAYALSGQSDKALDNLEKAANAGFTNRRQYESDSDLASLRESPRFKALMQRLN
jgi:ketosteroid isomerase-like protein